MGNCAGSQKKKQQNIQKNALELNILTQDRNQTMKILIKKYQKKLSQTKNEKKMKQLETIIERLEQEQQDKENYKDNPEQFVDLLEKEHMQYSKNQGCQLRKEFLQKKGDFKLTKVDESSILSRRSKISKSDISLPSFKQSLTCI